MSSTRSYPQQFESFFRRLSMLHTTAKRRCGKSRRRGGFVGFGTIATFSTFGSLLNKYPTAAAHDLCMYSSTKFIDASTREKMLNSLLQACLRTFLELMARCKSSDVTRRISKNLSDLSWNTLSDNHRQREMSSCSSIGATGEAALSNRRPEDFERKTTIDYCEKEGDCC